MAEALIKCDSCGAQGVWGDTHICPPIVPPMLNPNSPLVAVVMCGHCGNLGNLVGAIVPGFTFPCEPCGRTLEKGIVIRCAGCNRMSCADCVYRLYVEQFSSKLTPQ